MACVWLCARQLSAPPGQRLSWIRANQSGKNSPGTAALFFNGCRADQNPLPEKWSYVKNMEKYSDAVEEVLADMDLISSDIKTAFDYVPLEYGDSL